MKTIGQIMLILPFVALIALALWWLIATALKKITAPTDEDTTLKHETKCAIAALAIMIYYAVAFTLTYTS